jgi:hypothetical protein
MAIYRFRVTFEDYEDVYREIDMPSKSTFIDLHEEIHKSTGYAADASSSFYVSNDQWKKGTEIAFKPTQRKKDAEVLLMENIRLVSLLMIHIRNFTTFTILIVLMISRLN